MCEPYANFFSVLGNIGRLHIINALRTGDKNVGEISAVTGLEQTATSHNLRILESNEFVTSRKEGKYRIYSIANEGIEPLMRLIDAQVSKTTKISEENRIQIS